ncbi:hypothetical protein [Pseudomonas fulva]|uniref:hypothetical protein n=1 Tax=Pseudomonas fulva TaxID=47880 RepID=UPI003D9ACFBD
MLKFLGEPNTPERYRATTWICYCIVILLIAFALAAPLYSVLGNWMAQGESRGIWIQRSGAVTTLFSFIAGAMAVFTSGRLYTPGFFGNKHKLDVLVEFKYRFRVAEFLIFLLSILGTAVWGYGDLLYAWLTKN